MLTHHIQATASRTAQTAVLGFGAAVCLFIGLGFLTIAAWLFLTSLTTPLNTAMILGGVYSGVGFVLISAMSMRSRTKRKARAAMFAKSAPPAAAGDFTTIIAAFMTGLSAGQKARR